MTTLIMSTVKYIPISQRWKIGSNKAWQILESLGKTISCSGFSGPKTISKPSRWHVISQNTKTGSMKKWAQKPSKGQGQMGNLLFKNLNSNWFEPFFHWWPFKTIMSPVQQLQYKCSLSTEANLPHICQYLAKAAVLYISSLSGTFAFNALQ